MGNFGEDLRMERISRGIALEEISAVTKISQRHLVALEQGCFRLLPGGILSKGIVRGYAGAVGLDENDWTERFLNACRASGEMVDDERAWTAFASNVGKARMLRRDAVELRIRWAGAILLVLLVGGAGFFAVRYYSLRAGWGQTAIPIEKVHLALRSALHTAVDAVRTHVTPFLSSVKAHLQSWYQSLRDALSS